MTFDDQFLKSNGCNWPTSADITKVFQAIIPCVIQNKMIGSFMIQRCLISDIVNNLDSNCDYQLIDNDNLELNCWFSEFKLLDLSGLIVLSTNSVILTAKGFGIINSTNLEQDIITICQPYLNQLRTILSKRVVEKNLIERLYRKAYSTLD